MGNNINRDINIHDHGNLIPIEWLRGRNRLRICCVEDEENLFLFVLIFFSFFTEKAIYLESIFAFQPFNYFTGYQYSISCLFNYLLDIEYLTCKSIKSQM